MKGLFGNKNKSNKPHKVICGPTVFVDCDDTLVLWDLPENTEEEYTTITIECRGHKEVCVPNERNIELLKKFARRGHSIVVWSGSGSDWAESVVYALELEQYVSVIVNKPTFFIDDISDPSKWMGKHQFYDIKENQ